MELWTHVYNSLKIGQSHDPKSRMASLQAMNAGKLKLLRVIENADFSTEKWLHQKFDFLRLNHEWFSYSDEMLTIEAPNELPKSVSRDRSQNAKALCLTDCQMSEVDKMMLDKADEFVINLALAYAIEAMPLLTPTKEKLFYYRMIEILTKRVGKEYAEDGYRQCVKTHIKKADVELQDQPSLLEPMFYE